MKKLILLLSLGITTLNCSVHNTDNTQHTNQTPPDCSHCEEKIQSRKSLIILGTIQILSCAFGIYFAKKTTDFTHIVAIFYLSLFSLYESGNLLIDAVCYEEFKEEQRKKYYAQFHHLNRSIAIP